MAINGVTKNDLSDEWFTTQETVDLAIDLLAPLPKSVILCPYDSDKSLFVETLKNKGHIVLHGMSDFLDQMYHCDYILTNPPFSMKDKVIARVFEYGKRCVLILPIESLGGVNRHKMYKNNEYPRVYVPARRISYRDENGVLRKGASFHSILMTLNHGQKSEIKWPN